MVRVKEETRKAHVDFCRAAALERMIAEDFTDAADDAEKSNQIFEERLSAKEQMEQIRQESKVNQILTT